jgi:hypothetical protein
VKTKNQKDATRARVETASEILESLENQGPDQKDFWKPIRAQLTLIDRLLANDGVPTEDESLDVNIGWLAMQMMGEESPDVEPELLDLWELLGVIQSDFIDLSEGGLADEEIGEGGDITNDDDLKKAGS